MNRNKTKELLPIIQAFAEGKAIESRCVKGDKSLWYDDKDPSFDDDFEYRIKPEPNTALSRMLRSVGLKCRNTSRLGG